MPPLPSPGKGPLLVAEQLAFQKGVRDGGAVDGHKGLPAPGAGGMDGVGEQLLSCSALPADEDCGAAGGHLPGQSLGGKKGRALAHDAVKGVLGNMALSQDLAADLLLALLLVPEPLEDTEGPDKIPVSEHRLDADVYRAAADLHHSGANGLAVGEAFLKGQKGQGLLGLPVQKIPGGQLQNGLRLGVTGKDGAVGIHPDDPRLQGLLEKVKDAFHLDGAVEHPLDAVGVFRQGGKVGKKAGAVQHMLAFQVKGQFDEGVGAEEPGAQVDNLLHPVGDIPSLPSGDGQGEVGRLRGPGVVGGQLHLPHPQLVKKSDGFGGHGLVDVHQQGPGVPGKGDKPLEALPGDPNFGDDHRPVVWDDLGKSPADKGTGGDQVGVRRGDAVDGAPLDAVGANLDMVPQKVSNLAGVQFH